DRRLRRRHSVSYCGACAVLFFFKSRSRHTSLVSDWSSGVCSSDLVAATALILRSRDRSAMTAGTTPPADRPVVSTAPSDWVFPEIGRASCRERVEISEGAGELKKEREEEEQRRSRGMTGEMSSSR